MGTLSSGLKERVVHIFVMLAAFGDVFAVIDFFEKHVTRSGDVRRLLTSLFKVIVRGGGCRHSIVPITNLQSPPYSEALMQRMQAFFDAPIVKNTPQIT